MILCTYRSDVLYNFSPYVEDLISNRVSRYASSPSLERTLRSMHRAGTPINAGTMKLTGTVKSGNVEIYEFSMSYELLH